MRHVQPWRLCHYPTSKTVQTPVRALRRQLSLVPLRATGLQWQKLEPLRRLANFVFHNQIVTLVEKARLGLQLLRLSYTHGSATFVFLPLRNSILLRARTNPDPFVLWSGRYTRWKWNYWDCQIFFTNLLQSSL
jgi:hypothetical protein